MKKITRFYTLMIAAAIVAGCSTAPRTTSLLEQTRIEYTAAQSNPDVVRFAPVELKQAADALQQADMAASNRDKAERVDQLAYIARSRVATAQEAAKQRYAEANIATAAKEREQLRLEQRTAQVDQARLAAQDAKAQAAQLSAQLAELKAKQTERGMVVTLGDVLFGSGRSTLNPEGMRNVRKLADFMQQNPQRRVLVEGFTDSVGSESSNQALSERRATAVRDALLGMGIASDRVTTMGYGESYPIAPNDSAQNRRLNRRVEIVLSDESGKITPRR